MNDLLSCDPNDSDPTACCEPGDPRGAEADSPPVDEEADRLLASMARGLAHPVRVRILRVLAERDRCFCGEIVEIFELAQSTVSQHLKVLKEAGLVRGEVEGPAVCYCLDPAALDRFELLLKAIGPGADPPPTPASESSRTP